MMFSLAVAGGVVAQQSNQESSATSEWQQLGAEFAAPVGGPNTVVIEGDTYLLPTSGAELIVGEGLLADEPAQAEFGDQLIVSTPDILGAVAIIETPGDTGGTLDAYVGGFEESMDAVSEIFRDEDTTLTTAIYHVENGSSIQYMFISVDAVTMPGFHIIEVLLADPEDMEAGFETMQANLTIDGVPVFSSVDVESVVSTVLEDSAD